MSSASAWLYLSAVAVAHAYLAWHRLLAYLRYFQQEGYDAIRFLKWVRARTLGDPALWLSAVCALSASTVPRVATAAFVGGAIVMTFLQPDPQRSGKVLLRLTWRATRILIGAFVVALVAWLVLFGSHAVWSLQAGFTASALSYAALPLALIIANLVLTPYELRVQKGYEAEAIGKLQQVQPFIVGITGSYGKSSTKSMLAHILQFHGPTLAASGSINTLMGLTRHIRDELVPGHEFMVVEMGAFKRGSIRRLCQLAPPRAGIITAVGDMHLERFGSTDEIVKAKSELAFALPPGSVLVVNADSPGALRIAEMATHCRVLLYGERSERALDTRLEEVEFSKAGTTFVLRTGDRTFTCFTPLLGRPIVLNLAGAFTLAAALGVERDVIAASFRTLKPVSNRLEVVEERGVTWIRDAYNSNQFGFRAALEVAAALPAARRYLATPGVIELGPEQVAVNRTLAREAAAVCDATIIVAETNREAFAAGFRDAGRDAQLVQVAGRTEAFRWIGDNVQQGDLVILENDLPDLYERSVGLFWG